MERLSVALAAFLGTAAGFLVSIQLQWAIIRAIASDAGCDDLATDLPVCVAPEPLLILSVAGAIVGAMGAIVLLRRKQFRNN